MATARQKAYASIKHDIMGGLFPPGHQFKELDLAERCGVSRTPVRQALRELADEGLVQLRANRRASVPIVTETGFEEVFDLMSMLESYSAGLVATRIDAGEIAELEELTDRLAHFVARDRPEEYREFLDLNSQFHKAIHRASGNETLEDVLSRVIDFPTSVCLKFGRINWEMNPQSIAQHRGIIEALKGGEREWAALVMKQHTETVRRSFRKLWLDEVGRDS